MDRLPEPVIGYTLSSGWPIGTGMPVWSTPSTPPDNDVMVVVIPVRDAAHAAQVIESLSGPARAEEE